MGPEFAEKPEFDSSMPLEHYEVLAHAQRDIDAMHTIRVNHVDPAQLDDEAVHFYFGTFGKIGDISRPTDLKTRKYRDFMFIRYIRIQGVFLNFVVHYIFAYFLFFLLSFLPYLYALEIFTHPNTTIFLIFPIMVL